MKTSSNLKQELEDIASKAFDKKVEMLTPLIEDALINIFKAYARAGNSDLPNVPVYGELFEYENEQGVKTRFSIFNHLEVFKTVLNKLSVLHGFIYEDKGMSIHFKWKTYDLSDKSLFQKLLSFFTLRHW